MKIMDLEALPEGCIANIISLTSPRDACRLSLLSKMVKSAAESDVVWDKFLPPDTHQHILASSNPPPLSCSYNSKELCLALSDHPLLIDEGNMSFSLDKWSGKKCYMIAANRLRIAEGDNPESWKWISLPESRFEKVAMLIYCLRFEIRGRIDMSMLSSSTLYKAYLVYKFKDSRSFFFDNKNPMAVTVRARSNGFDYECPNSRTIIETEGLRHNAFLAPRKFRITTCRRSARLRYPEVRADGWLEMELGVIFCRGDEDGELDMICGEMIYSRYKCHIIVQGIEVRPKRN